MTIPKAIEILRAILRNVKPGDPPDEHDAIKLGIESLRLIKKQRSAYLPSLYPILPGETEE